jgi:hypothetical protein
VLRIVCLAFVGCLGACELETAANVDEPDAARANMPAGGEATPDVSVADASTEDASTTETSTADASASGFATYHIDVGAHAARIEAGPGAHPHAGIVTLRARAFDFAFNPSAQYILTRPTQPEDQLDWNKLPGISDCGQLDLARDGAMFGWRWRIDRTPPVLEVVAYANNAGRHLTSEGTAQFELEATDLARNEPLRYSIDLDGARYRFKVQGTLGARRIELDTTLPRRCATTLTNLPKWASGLYFGGTSTAPSPIQARIWER